MLKLNYCKLVFIFIFYTGIIVKSQQIEGEVTYTQITQLPKMKNAIGHLFFNGKYSLYTMEDEQQNTSIQHSNGSKIYPSNTIDSIANKTRFIFFNKNQNVFYNNIINSDIETILKAQINIDWKILPEYKKIINYRCQKAETIFYGKKYIAWFASDIAVSYGPLKINGLNGLILEVFTEDGKLKVNAEKIIFKKVNAEIDEFKSKYDFAKAIPIENYKNLLIQQQSDFETKLNATLKEGEKALKFGDIDCKECNEKTN